MFRPHTAIISYRILSSRSSCSVMPIVMPKHVLIELKKWMCYIDGQRTNIHWYSKLIASDTKYMISLNVIMGGEKDSYRICTSLEEKPYVFKLPLVRAKVEWEESFRWPSTAQSTPFQYTRNSGLRNTVLVVETFSKVATLLPYPETFPWAL
jgi:hypothetical protein